MSSLPPIPPHIARITAPLLFEVLWNWGLFGVLVVQTYVYSYNFPRDSRRLKLLVYVVFLLEAVQTVLSGTDLYYWFASGFGDMTHLKTPFASTFDVPIIEAIVSIVVQLFCAYRVWVLSKRQSGWICLLICLFSILNAAAGITGGIYTHIHSKFAPGDRNIQHIAITWLSATAVSDILIASAMVYYLIKRRKEADGFFHDNVLVKVVRLTVETNLLTTSVGIVSLLVIVIYPNENWYTCPTGILGKLYSNTLLVSLNNRISIRDQARTQAVCRPPPIAVAVTTSTHCTDDSITDVGDGQSSVAEKFPGIGLV